MKEKKISIVTPVFNGAEFIEECILSIKNQHYTNFEHIIMDGGSTDGTQEIVEKYIGTYPLRYIRQKDNGMYDAICRGFDLADGEIFAWLNSDDAYMPWAFQVMNYCVSKGVQWGMGLISLRNQIGVMYYIKGLMEFRQPWIREGYYGSLFSQCIEQESTFWTKDLWFKADSKKIANYRLAGDFQLWREFAKYEPMYSINTVISSFRQREGQLSSNFEKYRAEMNVPQMGMPKRTRLYFLSKYYEHKLRKARIFFNIFGKLKLISKEELQRRIIKINLKHHIINLPNSVGMNGPDEE